MKKLGVFRNINPHLAEEKDFRDLKEIEPFGYVEWCNDTVVTAQSFLEKLDRRRWPEGRTVSRPPVYIYYNAMNGNGTEIFDHLDGRSICLGTFVDMLTEDEQKAFYENFKDFAETFPELF